MQSQKNNGIVTGLSLIPWFHAYGFITTFAVMAMNTKIVFLIRFDEQQYLETIQNYKVSFLTHKSNLKFYVFYETSLIFLIFCKIVVYRLISSHYSGRKLAKTTRSQLEFKLSLTSYFSQSLVLPLCGELPPGQCN